MMLYIVVITLLISMGIVVKRAIKGPTSFDRMLAANLFGTKTVVLIAMLSIIVDDAMFLDIALVYALINFVTTIGFLKYFRFRSLGGE